MLNKLRTDLRRQRRRSDPEVDLVEGLKSQIYEDLLGRPHPTSLILHPCHLQQAEPTT